MNGGNYHKNKETFPWRGTIEQKTEGGVKGHLEHVAPAARTSTWVTRPVSVWFQTTCRENPGSSGHLSQENKKKKTRN